MRSLSRSATLSALAVAASLAVAACGGGSKAGDSTATSGTPAAADSTATSGTPAAAATAPAMTPTDTSAMKADSMKKADSAAAAKKKP